MSQPFLRLMRTRATFLPNKRPLDQEQVQAILDAHLRRAASLAPDTPSGYLNENGVPVVWDNPQVAALDWQQMVESDRALARHFPGSEAPVTPSLQVWSNGLPEPYGMLDRKYFESQGSTWDGYYRMGPGHSRLPQPQQFGPHPRDHYEVPF